MKFINYLIGTIFVGLVIVASTGYFISRTLLNANYLDSTLQSADMYNQISTEVIDGIKLNVPAQQKKIVESKIGNILTPEFITTKLKQMIFDTEKYLKSDGKIPEIDLSSVKTELSQNGINLSEAEMPSSLKLTGGSATNLAKNYQNYQKAQRTAWILLIVLTLIMLYIAISKKNFSNLITIMLINAFIQLGVFFGASKLLPIFEKKFIAEANFGDFIDFSNSLVKFVDILAKDLAKQGLIFCFGFASVAIILFILQRLIFRIPKTAMPTKN